EQAQHDRGRRQQDVVDEAYDAAQPAVAGELRQPGAGGDADRRAQQHGQAAEHEAADDGVLQAAGFRARRRRHPGEQLQAHRVQTLADRGPEDPVQPEQPEQRRRARQQQRAGIEQPPAQVEAFAGDGHQRPSRRFCRISISLAAASTTKVTMNSTKPRASRADWYIGVVASANSLAMLAAMELPGISSEALIWWALPSTKVTAMVSPRARPMPRKMPPTTA